MASPPVTFRLDDGFAPWDEVWPVFHDAVGDTAPRDHAGVLNLHYRDLSGRNDLVECQVARDHRQLFFHVRTREALSPATDPHWMWLLIDADQDRATGWEGYDFIVNRTVEGADETWLEKNAGGWNWTKVQCVPLRIEGNRMHLTLPRSALGLEGLEAITFDFKWVDHVQAPGDILDFYVSGDAAPDGRFSYRYVAEPVAATGIGVP